MRGMDRIRWTLLVLCALRWGATLVPAGCVWGIDAQRWVAPALAWPLMAAMALAVLGALRSRRPFTDFAFDPGPARALWPLALGAIVLVLVGAVPDRLRFVGDFGLRAGILESRNGFETIFPQALPLDRLVNHVLPVALGARLG